MFDLQIKPTRLHHDLGDRIESCLVSDDCRSGIEYKLGMLFASTSAELSEGASVSGKNERGPWHQPIRCAPVVNGLRPSQIYRRLIRAQ